MSDAATKQALFPMSCLTLFCDLFLGKNQWRWSITASRKRSSHTYTRCPSWRRRTPRTWCKIAWILRRIPTRSAPLTSISSSQGPSGTKKIWNLEMVLRVSMNINIKIFDLLVGELFFQFQSNNLEPTEKSAWVADPVDWVHLRDEQGAWREVKVRVERQDGTTTVHHFTHALITISVTKKVAYEACSILIKNLVRKSLYSIEYANNGG